MKIRKQVNIDGNFIAIDEIKSGFQAKVCNLNETFCNDYSGDE